MTIHNNALCLKDDYFTGCIDKVVIDNVQLLLLLPNNGSVSTCGPRSAHMRQPHSKHYAVICVCVLFPDRQLILKDPLKKEPGSWVEGI